MGVRGAGCSVWSLRQERGGSCSPQDPLSLKVKLGILTLPSPMVSVWSGVGEQAQSSNVHTWTSLRFPANRGVIPDEVFYPNLPLQA